MGIGKFAENLGAPDIKLAEFQLWVHSRQFPQAEDYWDGNWLNVTAHCGAQGTDVWVSGSILGAPDFASWLAALEKMNQKLSGEANLEGIEPELRVELNMKSLGHKHLNKSYRVFRIDFHSAKRRFGQFFIPENL